MIDPKIISNLRGLRRRKSTGRALLVASSHIGEAVLAAALAMAAFRVDFAFGAAATVLAVAIIGTRLRAVNNMSHECFHRTFVDDPRANEVFGQVFAIIELSSFLRFRREHGTHHRHLGDLEKDLDFAGLEKYGFHEPLDGSSIGRHLKLALTLSHVPTYAFAVIHDPTAPTWARMARVAYVGALACTAILAPAQFAIFCLTPFLGPYQIHKYLTDALDHGGLLRNEREVEKSRNFIVSNPLLRWLFFPRNDCYHLVHHMCPFIPVERFEEAHQVLMEDDSYRRRVHDAATQITDWLPIGPFKVRPAR